VRNNGGSGNADGLKTELGIRDDFEDLAFD